MRKMKNDEFMDDLKEMGEALLNARNWLETNHYNGYKIFDKIHKANNEGVVDVPSAVLSFSYDIKKVAKECLDRSEKIDKLFEELNEIIRIIKEEEYV